jgi:hypothetical protein
VTSAATVERIEATNEQRNKEHNRGRGTKTVTLNCEYDELCGREGRALWAWVFTLVCTLTDGRRVRGITCDCCELSFHVSRLYLNNDVLGTAQLGVVLGSTIQQR